MDEVFGNSSAETVVSVQDLDTKADLNEETAKCPNEEAHPHHKDEIEKQNSQEEESIPENDQNINLDSKEERTSNQVSVIKCINSKDNDDDTNTFKVPLIPPTIRQTQSVSSARPTSGVYSRARANSTSATQQGPSTTRKHHPYQNIPLNSPSLPRISFPSYVNISHLKDRKSGNLKSVNSPTQLNKSNSAPSTPRGSLNSPSPRVTHSYIQLWTGIRQDQCLAKEQDSSEEITATGYVSMSSPYVRSPNSSILSELASQLSSQAKTSNSKDIFCPFCPRPFTHELNLKHHIQAIHRHELHLITQENERVEVQLCPLCRARFFNLNLLPSHLLEFHRENVVDIFDRHKKIKMEGNEIKCPFCVKKVPSSKLGEDILLYHVLQLHSVEYEHLIRFLFEPLECLIDKGFSTKLSSEDLAHALSFKPGLTSTPGLSLKFKGLSCEIEDSQVQNSHTHLEETWSSHCAERNEKSNTNRLENQIVNKGILRSHTDLSKKSSNVKRELRFSVPPVTSEEFFIPESPESRDSSRLPCAEEDLAEQDENECPISESQSIPVRIDSLSSADFIEMTNFPRRKRRRLGIGLKSKKSFKKKKREMSHFVENSFDGLKSIGCSKSPEHPPPSQTIIATAATRTFRKPKPVSPSAVPAHAPSVSKVTTATIPPNVLKPTPTPAAPRQLQMRLPQEMTNSGSDGRVSSEESLEEAPQDISPFGSMKLYSPLRMFRCNSCRVKFCDNESLGSHIRGRHRGFLGFLRPQFGCGICSAKFYENKYLVKHCLQHHTSLLEIRSPKKHKITIYRFTQD